MSLCYYLPAILVQILSEIAIFMPEMPFNSASVPIRFPKFFLGISQLRVSMHANWTITYAYTVVLRRNLRENPDFYAKMLSSSIRSIPFNSELDPFLSLFM